MSLCSDALIACSESDGSTFFALANCFRGVSLMKEVFFSTDCSWLKNCLQVGTIFYAYQRVICFLAKFRSTCTFVK